MKVMCMLAAAGLFAGSSLFGNLITNADFSAAIPGEGWFVFDGGGGPGEIGDPVGAGYVSFSGATATVNAVTNTEVNFYHELHGLTPGVPHTFTVEISNLSLTSGTALVWSKGFTSMYGWLDQFPNETIVEGINTITFTPTGDGTNIYQLGVLFNGGQGSSLDFSNPVVIPEPGTYALLLGMFGLAFVLYRRRR